AALTLFDQGREAVVVLDEAHNLFDRARQYHSPFLDRARVSQLARRAAGGELFPDAAEYLARLETFLARIMAQSADEGPASVAGCRPLPRPAAAWDELATDAIRLTVRYAQTQAPVPPDDPLLGIWQTVVSLRDLLRADEPEFVAYARREGVGVLCLNPALRLARRHQEVLGTVAMSATLTPLAHYRKVLGFEALDPVEVAVDPALPAQRRCVVIVPTVSTTYRARAQNYGEIARTIARIVGVRSGHYVAYLPSFAFLAAVQARLPLPRDVVLVQRPGMTVPARERVLERLRTDPAPLLLLAVTGGMFAEGIDLPGEGLIGAIVVGPGLPQVGFERELMRRYFDATTRRGFLHAMLYPGMQRVIQSAGRVHRTPQDRGVIVLLDRRFARPVYADCLPSHWFRDGPQASVTRDPVPVLEAFWRPAGRDGAGRAASTRRPRLTGPRGFC
ncbi:MAG: ATP-dependent DNA helicase, partial [Planctomycetota bacterium]